MFYEIEYKPDNGIATVKAKNFTYIFHLNSHFKNYKLVGKTVPKDLNYGNFVTNKEKQYLYDKYCYDNNETQNDNKNLYSFVQKKLNHLN